MQFGSRTNRNFVWGALLAMVPDMTLASIIGMFSDNGLIGFLGTLIGLQLLYLLIWIKNSIWSWITFSYSGRKKLAALLLDGIRENNYPEPSMYEKSADGYLEAVASNDGLPVDIRLRAASEVGVMKFLESSMQVQRSMQISMAYEDAIEQHKRSFPQAG